MASVYQLKPAFQGLLRPLVKRLVKAGISANQVTLFAMLLSIATGIALWQFQSHPAALLLLPGILLVRMALNAVDGMIAREHNMKSKLGAILNELGDVISDTAIYLPLAFFFGFYPAVVVIFTFIAMLTEFAGIVAVQIGASRAYQGPMGKSDRAALIGIVGLLVGLGVHPEYWVNGLLVFASVLGLLTVINRSNAALKETLETNS